MTHKTEQDSWQQEVIDRLYRTHTTFRGANESLDFQTPFHDIAQTKQPSRYFGSSLWDLVTFWQDRSDRFYSMDPLHDYTLQFAPQQQAKTQKEKEVPTTAQLRNIRALRRKYQPLTYKQQPTRLRKNKQIPPDPDLNKNQKRILPTLTNTFAPIDFYTSYPTLGDQLRRYMMEAEHMATDATLTNKTSKLHDSYLLDRELSIQLRLDPRYITKIAKKLETVKNRDQFLEKEMQILLQRGKKRETEIQKSVRFVSQYMLPSNDLNQHVTGKKQKTNEMALSYRVQRELELNKRIMAVFDKPELYEDPFGLGLEPSVQATHPLSYDAISVFDAKPPVEPPPTQPTRQRLGRNISNRNINDTLPLIPKRRSRTTSALPFNRYNSYY
jgi:hypothetical protein